jgi:uncharacterized RDD family membrane protein YckC
MATPESPAAPGPAGPTPPGGWQQPIPRPGSLLANVALASWGSRVGATLLDALVLFVLLLVFAAPGTVLTAVSNGGALGIVLLVVGFLAYMLFALLYAAFFMRRDGRRNGQTLGKQWVGIRVIRTDGRPFDWGSALLRELVIKNLLFGVVGGAFASVPTLLDVLWPLWDDENRALHDMLASTRVVRS